MRILISGFILILSSATWADYDYVYKCEFKHYSDNDGAHEWEKKNELTFSTLKTVTDVGSVVMTGYFYDSNSRQFIQIPFDYVAGDKKEAITDKMFFSVLWSSPESETEMTAMVDNGAKISISIHSASREKGLSSQMSYGKCHSMKWKEWNKN